MGNALPLKRLEYFIDSGKHVIPCGSGALAREFQKKMRYFGVNVPFMVSYFTDEEKNIKEFAQIKTLENISDYIFVFCGDEEHFYDTYEPLRQVLNEVENERKQKVQFFIFSLYSTLERMCPRQLFDIHTHRTYLTNGMPFTKYGNREDGRNIHILTNSAGADISRYASRSWPSYVSQYFAENDVAANVYNWSTSNYNMGDFIIRLLRDVSLFRADVVIVVTNTGMVDNIRTRTGASNLLKTRWDSLLPQGSIRALSKRYHYPVSVGNNVQETLGMIYAAQLKVIKSLSKTMGFTCLNFLLPQADLLPYHIGEQFPGMRRPHMERARKLLEYLKDDDLPIHVIDRSHLFDDSDNIFNEFLDWRHFTTVGAQKIGECVARDIMAELNR